MSTNEIKKDGAAEIEAGIQGEKMEKPEAKPAAKKPAAKAAPQGDGSGFCVYVGPSIKAGIQHCAIFAGSKEETLEKLSPLVKKYPLVASLIVSGGTLAESRKKVRTPGNVLHENYSRLAGQLN